jgi:hypothetical protein
MLQAIAAFARFWYRFIVGDDWTIAAAVALALAGTYALVRAGIDAWWLVPAVVITALGLGLRRARGRT